MRAPFFRLLRRLRASYWFVPSVMAFFAIVLGALVVWLDSGPAEGLLDGLGWYQKAKPDGAHQVLSTIAGSMITVAGVVFSITIVAIAYAASQYGPRILTNFMSDRGNQITLGTFIATFVYCLVVLRTIRGGDEGQFVPQIAIMVALLLALCSIAVLIYFIHHVPRSIHINTVVARIGRQLIRALEMDFPPSSHRPATEKGQGAGHSPASADESEATVTRAGVDGYLEAIDTASLLDTACKHDVMVRIHRTPGDFVLADDVLISAWPASRVTPELRETLGESFDVGTSRTAIQDHYFLIDELAEIAARALSSGVNDPYTAITCLDWLGAATARLAGLPMPPSCRSDESGVIRLWTVPQSFAEFVERGFGRMRQYVARDMNAALATLNTLAAVSARCDVTRAGENTLRGSGEVARTRRDWTSRPFAGPGSRTASGA